MAIPKRVEGALNRQLNVELASAYAYLAMSAYCERQNLPGFGLWLRAQWEEELEHAMKFYSFVIDRGGDVRFDAIDEPRSEFSGVLEVFEAALRNEEAVTAAIHDLYTLVSEERDYPSQAFLNWFVTEQVEEEKIVGEVVDSIKRVGESGEALFLLDRELGKRQPEA
ncbi:MAG TPA: ferritin [Actinomycetota bacterium]|nr:ferritin [Actinomycetota bacterium]